MLWLQLQFKCFLIDTRFRISSSQNSLLVKSFFENIFKNSLHGFFLNISTLKKGTNHANSHKEQEKVDKTCPLLILGQFYVQENKELTELLTNFLTCIIYVSFENLFLECKV